MRVLPALRFTSGPEPVKNDQDASIDYYEKQFTYDRAIIEQ